MQKTIRTTEEVLGHKSNGSEELVSPKHLRCGRMTHKYRGSIVVLSISKSVEPNEEQKEMISGFQQGILCKY